MSRSAMSLVVLVALVGLAGCASFTSPARKHVLGEKGAYWFDYDVSRRGALLLQYDGQNHLRICAEPAPDVALDFASKFAGKGGYEKLSVEGSAELATSALQLAQRTQSIQYLRESLYRLCELSVNAQLSTDQAVKLYEQIMTTAKEIAQAEISQAKAAQAKAETRKAEIDLETRKLSREIVGK